MVRIVSILLFTFFTISAFSQNGKLLLIGGGSEKELENSWNSKAYKWAVDQSANKRVAIIAYGEASSWLPNYFINNCGAEQASNFNISNVTNADNQEIYDTIITYDVVFLKGGDQFNYYTTYRGRKIQQAIEQVYANGGVICGTSAGLAILSKVVYTAENGSAFSEETINDPFNDFVTLANDFFNFFPAYVFDSHFTIRARFGRLVGFMAHWKEKTGELISGLGVDEMTAMAIDENKIGTVFGIGTVNIYKAHSQQSLTINEGHLLADSITVTQLLQGCTYDFNTDLATGFTHQINPEQTHEQGNFILYATGSDVISDNLEMLDQFVNHSGAPGDSIVIITGSNLIYAEAYKLQLLNKGATQVNIVQATLDGSGNTENASKIEHARKILFVANTLIDLKSFMQNGVAGAMLTTKVEVKGIIMAFIGDNSRFAGKTVVDNYLQEDAAYFGLLKLVDGLGLLTTTVIIPNTFGAIAYFENMAAAIPYAMINKELAYGIWLNKANFIKYQPQNSKAYIHAFGNSPVMVLHASAGGAGNSIQTAYGDGYDEFPNFSGFEKMHFSVIDNTTPYLVGTNVATKLPEFIETGFDFSVTMAGSQIEIKGPEEWVYYELYDCSGKKLTGGAFTGETSFPNHNLSRGLYILRIVNKQATKNWAGKLFKLN